MQLLTHSRLKLLRTCPWAHYLRFELRLRRRRSEAPLRLGNAYHCGIERHSKGDDERSAIDTATAGYARRPEWADPLEWNVEQATVQSLLAGRFWRYQRDNLRIIQAERPWRMPLIDPESGRVSEDYELAGKIDAIGLLDDGRAVLVEYKTAGEDIGPDADYWPRLRLDPQISIYVLAVRHLIAAGELAVDDPWLNTIIYDVTRKPTIGPRQIPILDAQGCKIVTDAEGHRVFNRNGTPRQTASIENGWTLESELESAEQFGARLLADIGLRPDFYYARREVPRLEDELSLCRFELWQQAEELAERTQHNRWFRNSGRTTCTHCEFKPLCFNNVNIKPDEPPAGYEVLADAFPELSTEIKQ